MNFLCLPYSPFRLTQSVRNMCKYTFIEFHSFKGDHDLLPAHRAHCLGKDIDVKGTVIKVFTFLRPHFPFVHTPLVLRSGFSMYILFLFLYLLYQTSTWSSWWLFILWIISTWKVEQVQSRRESLVGEQPKSLGWLECNVESEWESSEKWGEGIAVWDQAQDKEVGFHFRTIKKSHRGVWSRAVDGLLTFVDWWVGLWSPVKRLLCSSKWDLIVAWE